MADKKILKPMEEPSEPLEPMSDFDRFRATSQPDMEPQDYFMHLFGRTQTFTERQINHREMVKEYGNPEAFGDLEFQRHNDTGGMNFDRGDVLRRKR